MNWIGLLTVSVLKLHTYTILLRSIYFLWYTCNYLLEALGLVFRMKPIWILIPEKFSLESRHYIIILKTEQSRYLLNKNCYTYCLLFILYILSHYLFVAHVPMASLTLVHYFWLYTNGTYLCTVPCLNWRCAVPTPSPKELLSSTFNYLYLTSN